MKQNEGEVRRMLTMAKQARNTTFADIARATGQSPQNLNGKISRGTLSVAELKAIAKVLDAEIALIDRKTMKVIAGGW